jgi:Ca2+-binding EF-hand superfamily protein
VFGSRYGNTERAGSISRKEFGDLLDHEVVRFARYLTLHFLFNMVDHVEEGFMSKENFIRMVVQWSVYLNDGQTRDATENMASAVFDLADQNKDELISFHELVYSLARPSWNLAGDFSEQALVSALSIPDRKLAWNLSHFKRHVFAIPPLDSLVNRTESGP